jgi:TolA-binding protein
MKQLLAAALLATLVLPLAAQQRTDAAKADTEKSATDEEKKPYLLDVTEARAKSGRVPNGYGKLGLTRDQRERIYGIQAAYADRLKELEAEIAQLKDEQVLQMKDVLSESQRTQIESYEARTTARRGRDS